MRHGKVDFRFVFPSLGLSGPCFKFPASDYQVLTCLRGGKSARRRRVNVGVVFPSLRLPGCCSQGKRWLDYPCAEREECEHGGESIWDLYPQASDYQVLTCLSGGKSATWKSPCRICIFQPWTIRSGHACEEGRVRDGKVNVGVVFPSLRLSGRCAQGKRCLDHACAEGRVRIRRKSQCRICISQPWTTRFLLPF